jgi:hypothetical protein
MNFVVSITLFTVFAVVLTVVLLTGASSFKQVSVHSQERYEQRTPLLYAAQKIRGFDRVDSVSYRNAIRVADVYGTRALVLSDELHDIYIYEYDGYLTEFLAFSGGSPILEAGIKLFSVESAEFEFVSESLIRVTIDEASIYVNLTAGKKLILSEGAN